MGEGVRAAERRSYRERSGKTESEGEEPFKRRRKNCIEQGVQALWRPMVGCCDSMVVVLCVSSLSAFVL